MFSTSDDTRFTGKRKEAPRKEPLYLKEPFSCRQAETSRTSREGAVSRRGRAETPQPSLDVRTSFRKSEPSFTFGRKCGIYKLPFLRIKDRNPQFACR
jgi:hypothetical protein